MASGTLDTETFWKICIADGSTCAGSMFVQAKTYNGGSTWYTLDIDYEQVATILHNAGYGGWVSLEFGKDDPFVAIPKILSFYEILLQDKSSSVSNLDDAYFSE